ncbi:MAG: 1,2-phenylacetyl-CoA epoxidase subunit PaaC [Chloroflexota bacterium]
MNEQLKQLLINRLTALADDELILAHRDSEWTGYGPILEEDIALSNISQDELGHATVIYGLVEALTGTTPDRMAFFRDADAFLNAQLVELPRGDWAFTMLRQYLFDTYEHVLLTAVSTSLYQPLADAVAKFRGEEMYHLRHTHVWVERLGIGTIESNGRMQDALDTLWPYTAQLFNPMPGEEQLIEAGYFPNVSLLKEKWEQIVLPHLETSELSIPNTAPVLAPRSQHTPHLEDLLADMQKVARWDPQAEW